MQLAWPWRRRGSIQASSLPSTIIDELRGRGFEVSWSRGTLWCDGPLERYKVLVPDDSPCEVWVTDPRGDLVGVRARVAASQVCGALLAIADDAWTQLANRTRAKLRVRGVSDDVSVEVLGDEPAGQGKRCAARAVQLQWPVCAGGRSLRLEARGGYGVFSAGFALYRLDADGSIVSGPEPTTLEGFIDAAVEAHFAM